MRDQMVVLKTVLALQAAYAELLKRDPGVPGMMLITGESGTGKSTAVKWLCEKKSGVMVRALSCDTPLTLLNRIMVESGQPAGNYLGNGQMVQMIATNLKKRRQSLFVDECDNLFGAPKLLETLRDIHDIADVPVVLIGHAGVERRMQGKQQLFRRISQWVNFVPADVEDTCVLARNLCEVSIADDLLAHVHAETRGNPGLLTVALSRIEAYAKGNKSSKVTLDQWGERALYVNPRRRVA